MPVMDERFYSLEMSVCHGLYEDVAMKDWVSIWATLDRIADEENQ